MHLPRTAGGRHCDFSPPTALVAAAAGAGITDAEVLKVIREANDRVGRRGRSSHDLAVERAQRVPGFEPLAVPPGAEMFSNGTQVVVGFPRSGGSYDSFVRRPGRATWAEQLKRSGF